MSPYSVCHITSVHPAFDVRIFHKECTSVARAGYKTVLIATDCEACIKSGVFIKSVSHRRGGRVKRIFLTAWRVYRKGVAENADLYHFHDPELLPFGFLLKVRGKKVIYDAHENVPEDILAKDWIPRPFRRLISSLVKFLENWIAKRLDCVVAATPSIYNRFKVQNCNVVNVNNYPIIGELLFNGNNNSITSNSICYVGAIDEYRGIREMVAAVYKSGMILLLAGDFSPKALRDEIVKIEGWHHVKEFGRVSRREVAQIFRESIAGLVIFHPGPNHTDSQPNKLFEYMSANLPIIASNFPLWKEIIEGNQCGICVDPLNLEEISNAIKWIHENPTKAAEMGKNGYRAVVDKYNWDFESKKLLNLYSHLLFTDCSI